jgi:hypothetical protein
VCDDAVQNLRSGGHASGSQGLVEAKKVAVDGHPFDGESFKSSKTDHDGLVSVVIREGYFKLSVASI